MNAGQSIDATTQTVGVVIVNYNAGDHLLDAVESAQLDGADQIVVVDNGSSDGSPEKLLERHPELQLLRLPNPGFGAGNNAGVKELHTDIAFCMNPDTVVHPGAIAQLKEALNSHPEVGVVGPRLLNPDGSVYPSARAFPKVSNAVGHAVLGMAWPNNPWSRRYKRLDAAYDTAHEVDWVSGAALFARRNAFDSVNGFDDVYFMYLEDVDLCWRLRNAGWKVLFEPAASLTHVGGVSTGKKPYRMLKEHHRSAIRYNLRTARGVERMLLPVLILGLSLRLPVAWFHHYVSKRKN